MNFERPDPNVVIVTPAPRGSRKGNRITAERWQDILRKLGARVRIIDEYRDEPAHILVALHARKSAKSIKKFHKVHPESPLIVVLTGTDLYRDLATSKAAQRSLELATHLIVLQPEAMSALESRWRSKTRVVLQSALPPRRILPPRADHFEICVVGHLRAVKDPFRAAMAARLLPADSSIRIIQIGSALTSAMEARANREMKSNPRYQWIGELPYEKSKERMARCRALVLSSKLEGGANVISEAIVADVPVVASRIAGSIGLLGADYPGFFNPGDTAGLSRLMLRLERDPKYLTALKDWCSKLKPQFTPQHESLTWKKLLLEMKAARHSRTD